MVDKVRADKNTYFGFNAANEQYGDLVREGVIEPAKVARTSVVKRGLDCQLAADDCGSNFRSA